VTGAGRRLALGLAGWPVGHSVSPAMHRAALAAAGLPGIYDALPTPDLAALDDVLGRLRAGVLDGVNVTLPWKLEALARCDHLTETARDAGAVNTLRVSTDGGLEGDNTDVPGLVAAVGEAFPRLACAGRPVAVVGAGGAGRGAVLAASRLGAAEIRVHNRTHARAERLVLELARGVAVERLEVALDGAALVLQASSLGLGLSPEASETEAAALARPLAALAPGAAVMDLVYGSHPTPWTLAADRAGILAADGLGMLVHQAALAFERWTGVTPDVAAMRAAAQRELAARAP
jgi:shikimate dehydrogenase